MNTFVKQRRMWKKKRTMGNTKMFYPTARRMKLSSNQISTERYGGNLRISASGTKLQCLLNIDVKMPRFVCLVLWEESQAEYRVAAVSPAPRSYLKHGKLNNMEIRRKASQYLEAKKKRKNTKREKKDKVVGCNVLEVKRKKWFTDQPSLMLQ